MKKKLLVLAIAILLALSTSALLPTTSSRKPNTIRIGVVFPDAEWRSWYQPVFEDIIKKDINAYLDKLPNTRFTPDLNIEFLYEDAQAGEGQDPRVLHLEKVEYFASIGIDLVIGGFFSSQAGPAVDYMTKNKMLLFSPSSTSSGLALPDDALYRLAPTDSKQGQALAEMIIRKGVTSLIIIRNESPEGTWSTEAFELEYLGKGGSILNITTYEYDPDETNFTDILRDVEDEAEKHEDIDGILLFAYQEAADILGNATSYDTIYDLPWFGFNTAMSEQILENAFDEAVNVTLIGPVTVADNSSKYWEMAERYENLTWGNNSYLTANMIDAAWIIAQAVLETKSSFSTRRFPINAVDIMEVLPDVASRYYGYSGWCQLDEAGDRANANYEIWGYGLVDGEPSFVKYGWYDMWTDTVYWDD